VPGTRTRTTALPRGRTRRGALALGSRGIGIVADPRGLGAGLRTTPGTTWTWAGALPRSTGTLLLRLAGTRTTGSRARTGRSRSGLRRGRRLSGVLNRRGFTHGGGRGRRLRGRTGTHRVGDALRGPGDGLSGRLRGRSRRCGGLRRSRSTWTRARAARGRLDGRTGRRGRPGTCLGLGCSVGRRGLRRDRLAQPTCDGCFHRRGRRLHELALLLELRE
jgi:hypothetical protein